MIYLHISHHLHKAQSSNMNINNQNCTNSSRELKAPYFKEMFYSACDTITDQQTTAVMPCPALV